jgi:dUTP pyrophosphatase
MLHIKTDNPELRVHIQNLINSRRPTDSGFDIPMINQSRPWSKQITFDFDITVAATDSDGNPYPLLLVPRSSISNSPFRLSNSIGLIDMGYRGTLKAKVDVIEPSDHIFIGDGTRYFQLCRQSWMPWESVKLVDELPPAPDSRGSGGFGSTGH